MPYENPGWIAGGDIRPSRFVKQSTAADYTVLEADANEQTVGISSDATSDAPFGTSPSANAASTTSPQILVNPIGSVCLLKIGSGGVTRGANIKSDADGNGVLSATTGTTMQWVGATALETALEGELARVRVVSFPHYPALA